jgi:hypothetical protein
MEGEEEATFSELYRGLRTIVYWLPCFRLVRSMSLNIPFRKINLPILFSVCAASRQNSNRWRRGQGRRERERLEPGPNPHSSRHPPDYSPSRHLQDYSPSRRLQDYSLSRHLPDYSLSRHLRDYSLSRRCRSCYPIPHCREHSSSYYHPNPSRKDCQGSNGASLQERSLNHPVCWSSLKHSIIQVVPIPSGMW